MQRDYPFMQINPKLLLLASHFFLLGILMMPFVAIYFIHKYGWERK